MQTYDDAVSLRSKIKHFGVDSSDGDEIRKLLYRLMVLSEFFMNSDVIAFTRNEICWSIVVESQISEEAQQELMFMMGE